MSRVTIDEDKNMTKKEELEPLCLKVDLQGDIMQVAIDNRGHLIPCCYCDTPENQKDINYQKLLEVSKISNYNNIEEIYLNKEWIEFVKNLKNNIGFNACYLSCRKNKDPNNITLKERTYFKGKLLGKKDI